jgi:hypothetical protein
MRDWVLKSTKEVKLGSSTHFKSNTTLNSPKNFNSTASFATISQMNH